MQRLALVITAIAVLTVGCKEQRILQPPASQGPAYMISDAGHSGNHFFFFLPPLAPDPSALFHPGTFNARLSPVVEVCPLTGDPSSGSPVDCLTSAGIPVLVFGPAPMALDATNERYTRNWDTKSPTLLDPTKFYRILVRGAPRGTALGFLDVDPIAQGLKNLRTGEVVPFQNGRTLPIKVRIEDGAFGSTNPDHVERVVGNVATTVTTNTGFAGASFPDNWLPQGALDAGINQVVLIIERIPVGPGTNDPTCLQSGLLEREGCYRFRTDPDLLDFGPFSQLVTAGVCFEAPDLIGNANGPPLELHRRVEVAGAPAGPTIDLAEAPATFLTCARFGPTPPPIGTITSGRVLDVARAGWHALVRGIGRLVTPGALHAVDLGAGGRTNGFSRIGWARHVTMTKVDGTDGNSAPAGTTVTPDPAVCLTLTHHGVSSPLGNEPVTFTIMTGGGTVGGLNAVTVNTDVETGCAHAPWRLGTTPGPNTLTAAALASGSPLTFTAIGTGTIATSGVTVDAGGYHSCALKAGQAFCWGNNRGQLGDGTPFDRLVPTAVAGGLTFAALSAGDGATCGLTPTGAAYCWGFNSGGQLGDGTTTDRLSPTPVAGGLTFAALSAGNNGAGGHTCGVTTNGAPYCWGHNGNGQLGDGTTTDRLVPTPVAGGVTFAALITGGQHTCGVTTSGAAYCWGFNGAGGLGDGTTTQRLLPTLVAGGLTFAALSAGEAHTCGVTQASAAYCWGFNASGELGDGTTTSGLVPTPVGAGLSFAALSAGFGYTCGVTTTGTPLCWGFNGQGELGDGTTTERHIPTLVAGGLSFAAASAGSQHTCGVTTSGVVYCWGLNGNGQVGDGTTTTRLVPTAVALPGSEPTPDYRLSLSPAALMIVHGATGNTTVTITRTNFTGAVTLSLGNAPAGVTGSFNPAAPTGTSSTLTVSVGAAVAPGVYNLTVDGTGTPGNRSTPLTLTVSAAPDYTLSLSPAALTIVQGATGTSAVTITRTNFTGAVTLSLGNAPTGVTGSFNPAAPTGTTSTLTVSVGAAVTAGVYNLTVDGAGTPGNRSTSLTLTVSAPVSAVVAPVSAGFGQTCGVTPSAAYCWGLNNFGQLGNGTTTNSDVPVAVSGGLTFAAVSAGTYHNCGVTPSDAAYCWGYNLYGQLGNGTTTNSATPVAVSGGLTFAAVSAGTFHTCGVIPSGAAYCWGTNSFGQLGNGTTTNSLTPVAVSGGLAFAAVSAGSEYTCGVTPSGAAYCWGNNFDGNLGNGTTTNSATPFAVSGGLTFAAVSAGVGHTCGVTPSGAAYCWGRNNDGELGNGTTTSSTTPIAVSGGLTFAALSAGGYTTCGVTPSGAAYCWGNNNTGGLGNGTQTNSTTPVAVSGGLTFASVTAGSFAGITGLHTCGVTPSGAAYCWGYNFSGQLGNGTTTQSLTPVTVSGGRTFGP